MSKGKTLKLHDFKLKEIEEIIRIKNENTTESPWSICDVVYVAVHLFYKKVLERDGQKDE